MKFTRSAAIGACAACLPLVVAYAEDVAFSGTVLASCTVVATPGVLGANATFDVLSSKEAGGLAGGAVLTATNNTFTATIGGPSAFTSAPSGGDANVTFLTEYAATGASTASGDSDSAPTFSVGAGVTNISVDETASKPSGEFFPAGAYTATATVTCAP